MTEKTQQHQKNKQKTRKLFCAIFRYSKPTMILSERELEHRGFATFSSSNSVPYFSSPPYFYFAYSLEEAQNIMSETFSKLKKTKGIDVVSLFVRECEEDETNSIQKFVANSKNTDDISSFVFNNDEIGGYTEMEKYAYFVSPNTLKHMGLNFKDNQYYRYNQLDVSAGTKWQKDKYIQGFILNSWEENQEQDFDKKDQLLVFGGITGIKLDRNFEETSGLTAN